MSEKDVNKNTGSFSWKAETDEALGSYIEKGKDKKSYASSIFSSQGNNDYSYRQGDYKYDFPKDNGYIYSPSAHTASTSQNKSAIFSDRANRAAPSQEVKGSSPKNERAQQGRQQ